MEEKPKRFKVNYRNRADQMTHLHVWTTTVEKAEVMAKRILGEEAGLEWGPVEEAK